MAKGNAALVDPGCADAMSTARRAESQSFPRATSRGGGPRASAARASRCDVVTSPSAAPDAATRRRARCRRRSRAPRGRSPRAPRDRCSRRRRRRRRRSNAAPRSRIVFTVTAETSTTNDAALRRRRAHAWTRTKDRWGGRLWRWCRSRARRVCTFTTARGSDASTESARRRRRATGSRPTSPAVRRAWEARFD